MRLPGRCAKCGARVELASGRVFVSHDRRQKPVPLPLAWCEPGSDETHECARTNIGSGTMEGPGAAETAPAMPRTSLKGPKMAHRSGAH